MINKAIILGNVGRDPEVRSMQDGSKIVTMNVATTENWTDKKTGEKKSNTEWHRVVIFNKNIATIAEKYIRKGAKVYIEGKIKTRKWSDQSGIEKFSTEIVLSGFDGEIKIIDGPPKNNPNNVQAPEDDTELDDDIPF